MISNLIDREKKVRNKRGLIAALVLVLFLLSGNIFAEGTVERDANAGDNVQGTVDSEKRAKFVFLFIGDGMSMTQITAAEKFLQAKESDGPGIQRLGFTTFPSQGFTTTYASNAFITDSAAAGTALACGEKTETGVIGMDSTKTRNLKSIAEYAKEQGMKVGIITTVNLDHATPAAFYAHSPSRGNYFDINIALANSDFDYFAGGMVRISKTPEGERSAHDIMKENGTVMVSTRDQLNAVKRGTDKVYAYNRGFAFNALDYSIDQDADDITLAEFTKKGIDLLENDKGFFIMVESGKIDWACHANDAGASIYDTIAFDEAIGEALAFYRKHPNDTLIVVTGDHETGGLSLGFAGSKYSTAFDVLKNQKRSFEGYNEYVFKKYKETHTPETGRLEDLLPSLEENFGLTNLSEYEYERLSAALKESLTNSNERVKSTESYLLYGYYEPFTVTVTHLLNQRAGIAWASYSHTGVPVPTFAIGVSSDMFNGYYDNTDIFAKMMKISGLRE